MLTIAWDAKKIMPGHQHIIPNESPLIIKQLLQVPV
jgi:hypothetical protein